MRARRDGVRARRGDLGSQIMQAVIEQHVSKVVDVVKAAVVDPSTLKPLFETAFERTAGARSTAWTAFGVLGLTSVLSYALPSLWYKTKRVQNLKLKYNAQWAVVTGGSSG